MAPLTVDEAMRRLAVIPDYDPGGGEGPGPCVHSFRTGTGMMLGAHWRLEQVRAAMKEFGVKETDGFADHNLLVVDSTGPVVFETKPES